MLGIKNGKSYKYANPIKIPKTDFSLIIIKLKETRNDLEQLKPKHKKLIKKIYLTLVISLYIFNKNKKKYLTEVIPFSYYQIWKTTKLNSKKLAYQMLQTSLNKTFRTLVCYRPFWNKECDLKSEKLWLPPLEKPENNKEYKPVQEKSNERKEEDIRIKKIKLKPNYKTREIIKEWCNTSRAVYNKGVDEISKDSKNANFYQLRNKYVTAKSNEIRNDNVKDWMLNTPKDIRAGALKNLVTGFKSGITNLKRKTIKFFNLKYRLKKSNTQVIEIPKTAIKILDNKQIKIFGRYIKDGIKHSKERRKIVIDHDCKLEYRYPNEYHLLIPYKRKYQEYEKNRDIIALDPGVRKFMTAYSQEETRTFNPSDKIDVLNAQIDSIRSLSPKNKKKAILKRELKVGNLIKEFHYSVVNYLTKTYNKVFLPTFETSAIIKHRKDQEDCGTKQRVIGRSTARRMNNLSHYKFKQRLLHRCELTNTELYLVNEAYTSKTCTKCGCLNNVGSSETYNCLKCGLVIDRDINGARNIFIKNVC